MKDANRRGGETGGGWAPKGGLVLKQIEFDKRILNELRDMAEADGVKSVYQMIRNACYQYVKLRKEGKIGA